jgi:hypothetical protein
VSSAPGASHSGFGGIDDVGPPAFDITGEVRIFQHAGGTNSTCACNGKSRTALHLSCAPSLVPAGGCIPGMEAAE